MNNLGIRCLAMVLGLVLLCSASAFGAIAGDVDGSNEVDLKDAITALRVCVGLDSVANTNGDANNDDKIGLEEAIFALQVISDIRELTTWYKDADGDRISDGTTLLSVNRPSDDYYEETELFGISGDTDDNNPLVHAALPPEIVVVQSFIEKNDAEWVAAPNPISDLPEEERILYLGFLPDEIDKTRIKKYKPKQQRSLPSSFDWRNNNGVTSVKNQGGCGSCWAFATVAGLEAQMLISSGLNLDLSEQIVLSCSGAGDCGGGYISTASDFLRDTGTALENCYPYTATNGNCNNACSDWRNNTYKIDSWSYVVWGKTATVSEIKNAIYESGPVVSTFTVYEDFYSYDSGVYSYVWGQKQGGHAILIVGWDDPSSAFIVKNSWGNWGDNGYFRIAFSELDGKIWFGRYTIAYHSEECTYSISPTSKSFEASGGTGSVSLTAPNDCSWTAKSNVAWITIISGSSGNGNGIVNYRVSENTGTTSRTGTIIIAGKTFTVTQSAPVVVCTYSISPTSKSFQASGGTGNVSVSTSSGCEWTATSNNSWITINSGTSGSGNGTVSYSVASCSGESTRTGTITIAGKTFTVTQYCNPITDGLIWDNGNWNEKNWY